MPKAAARDPIYRGRRFPAETIELCVRWYRTYRLSYRDLSAMMAERGIDVSHTTILRWVLRYVPEYERRWARFALPTGTSWRMDETVVRVRGGLHWLYRAVDREGKSVHSFLSNERTTDAAQAFFQGAVGRPDATWPRTINLDGNRDTHQSLANLRELDSRWAMVKVRENRYINNRIEQDHRAIKQRCASKLGHKTFGSAAITLAGVELAHRIRKGQFALPTHKDHRAPSLDKCWEAALHVRSGDVVAGAHPPMHRNSISPLSTHRIRYRPRPPRRFAVTVLLGQSLYLVVKPNGTRFWRNSYQHQLRRKSMSLGEYPLVSLKSARLRQQAACRYVAAGVDPRTQKLMLRRISARKLAAAQAAATLSHSSLQS
jgi:transposase-like protein